jgi:mercuric ion binding protein
MNIKVLFLALALVTGLCMAQSSLAKATVPTVNSTQSIVLDMQNMTCPLCKFTIKKSLLGVEGVQNVDVDSDKKTASITFNGQKTNVEALIKATTHAGYPATVHPKK